MRLLQHKEEAYWFYRYLSIIYDRHINPWFHTPNMRDQGLLLAELKPGMEVVDVGAGSGFVTEAIVKVVGVAKVTALDQSDYQLANAKKKKSLQGVAFHQGDAEQLPFTTDRFDRYVSSGSIEYWPDPQRAIAEAYRVIKPEGTATILGPIKPKHWLGRFLAEVFMLFPTVEEYLEWYKKAGFIDVKYILIRPPWIKNEQYALTIVGRKPKAGVSPWVPPTPTPEESLKAKTSSQKSRLLFLTRFSVGSLAGGAFLPMAILMTAFRKCSPSFKTKE